jgi:hypothetical protein
MGCGIKREDAPAPAPFYITIVRLVALVMFVTRVDVTSPPRVRDADVTSN